MVDGCCAGPHRASPPQTGVLLRSSPLEGQWCEWRREGVRACPRIQKATRGAVLRVSRARSVFPLPLCGLSSLQHRGHQDFYLKSCLGPQEHTHVHANWHTYDHTLTHIPKHTRECVLSHFSRVRGSETLWTVARQAPLSNRSSRQECWSGLPCLPPGALPDPGIESTSHTSCTGRQVLYH